MRLEPVSRARVASQAQSKRRRVAGVKKSKQTMKERNAALPPGMAASGKPWSLEETRKVIKAFLVHGNNWEELEKAVGSRTAKQCDNQIYKLRKAGKLDPITRDTPLAEKKLKSFSERAITICAKEIDGKRITTVGQLADLDLDVSKPQNKIYLMKLTGKPTPSAAVKMAAPWQAKAKDALALWE